jgi:5-(carboxyamino)imidazole ribonucleotide mutase
MSRVIILMGSTSDSEIMKKAETVLLENEVEAASFVASAHRNPEKLKNILETEKYDVVIAGAGMAAHLPGVVASMTQKPVIGVPINSGSLNGMDALLAIVQMPPGIPVATVAVNGAKNAGILALQILGVSNQHHAAKLRELRESFKT